MHKNCMHKHCLQKASHLAACGRVGGSAFLLRGSVVAVASALAMLPVASAVAQTASPPDAGQIWRENQPPVPPQPRQGQSTIQNQVQQPASVPASSKQVTLAGFRFEGNHAFSDEELMALLPEAYRSGREFNVGLDQVLALTGHITNHYRKHGYFVAVAYAGPQTISNRILTISILEGEVDSIYVRENKSIIYSSHLIERILNANYCGYSSCERTPVEQHHLERATGVVSDLPGMGAVSSTLVPGKSVGTTQIGLSASPGKRYEGSVGLDNFGNRHIDRKRLLADLAINNLVGVGDRIHLTLNTSGSGLLGGGVGYSQLVGYKGLRLGGNYTYGTYELGGIYKSLSVKGNTHVFSPYASYPVIRRLENNLHLRASLDYKLLEDEILGSKTEKTATGYSLGLAGNSVDHVLGTSFNSYGLTWSSGKVKQADNASNTSDSSLGSYDKLSYNLVRDQFLLAPAGHRVSLYGSLYGQTTDKNLVSSEKLALGGPSGVRAYPNGESGGDISMIGSLELRYAIPIAAQTVLTTALFRDRGWQRVNAKPTSAQSEDNRRILSGSGASLSLNDTSFSARLVYAKRDNNSQESTSDKDEGRWWLQAAWLF